MALHLLKELPTSTVQTALGERSGLVTHAVRTMSGIAYEVFQVLRKEPRVLALPEFIAARARLVASARRHWDEIVVVANDPSTITKASPYWIARNKASFHYDDDLVRGFLHGFDPSTAAADGEPAYSDGDTMERTRFFFADVAARATVASLVGGAIADQERAFVKLTGHLNLALKPMLIELRRARTP